MIVVHSPDGESHDFPSANRFKTDEHNNLELLKGAQNAPEYVACFNTAGWDRVVVEDGEEATRN